MQCMSSEREVEETEAQARQGGLRASKEKTNDANSVKLSQPGSPGSLLLHP